MNDIITIIIGLAIMSFVSWQSMYFIKDLSENHHRSAHERNKNIIIKPILGIIGCALVCGSVIFLIFSRLFT